MTNPTETEILQAVHEAREAHGRYIAAVDAHDDAHAAYVAAQARVIELIRVAEPKSHGPLAGMKYNAGPGLAGRP